jgi:hypothetical protein
MKDLKLRIQKKRIKMKQKDSEESQEKQKIKYKTAKNRIKQIRKNDKKQRRMKQEWMGKCKKKQGEKKSSKK